MIERCGVVYHPARIGARELALSIAEMLLRRGAAGTVLSSWDDEKVRAAIPEWQMVITCGGDGTILRTTRLAAPVGVPQLGVNLGRLGFLAELRPDEVASRLPDYLDGDCWIEERTMLRVDVVPKSGGHPNDGERPRQPKQFDALNEVLVARGILPRLISVGVAIDDRPYHTFGGDGVLVATATGSTAYSLSAGGPVMHPRLRNLLLTPVCSHPSRGVPLVLPAEAEVRLDYLSNQPAVVSVDGQLDVPIETGDSVIARVSPHVARFVRSTARDHFFEVLNRVLP